MKLTVVGAGGIRMPLFVRSLLRRVARGTKIDTLAMSDIRADRLAIMGGLTRHLVREAGDPFAVQVEPDLDQALAGANAVVTTIRPGFEEGRIADETICKEAGILGQETVGAGGYAMTGRSVPDLLHICRRTRAVADNALILNFTNPAGMVTQALHDQGFHEVVGICDSADNVKDYVALSYDIDVRRLRSRVFGLNHLSATMQVWLDDEDITAQLMDDDAFLDKWFGIFGRDLVRELGAFPNEYLYYYLLSAQAVPAVLAEPETRGSKTLHLTERFFAATKDPVWANEPAKLLAHHAACIAEREASYMDYAWKETDRGQRPDHHLAEGEGYAGVALDVLEAATVQPAEIALSTPNRGAVEWLADHDVVEITCRVDANGLTPLAPPRVPARLAALVNELKVFETLTVMSLRHRSRRVALYALESHPLVGFHRTAMEVLDRFLAAHPALRVLQ